MYPTVLVEASIVRQRDNKWKPTQTTVTGANQKATLRIEFEATPVPLGPGDLVADPRASR